MKKTLLQIAKEVKLVRINREKITREEAEVAVAYLNQEITAKQVLVVLKIVTKSQVTPLIATIIRTSVAQGLVSVKML